MKWVNPAQEVFIFRVVNGDLRVFFHGKSYLAGLGERQVFMIERFQYDRYHPIAICPELPVLERIRYLLLKAKNETARNPRDSETNEVSGVPSQAPDRDPAIFNGE